jgi:hypothetical protein
MSVRSRNIPPPNTPLTAVAIVPGGGTPSRGPIRVALGVSSSPPGSAALLARRVRWPRGADSAVRAEWVHAARSVRPVIPQVRPRLILGNDAATLRAPHRRRPERNQVSPEPQGRHRGNNCMPLRKQIANQLGGPGKPRSRQQSPRGLSVPPRRKTFALLDPIHVGRPFRRRLRKVWPLAPRSTPCASERPFLPFDDRDSQASRSFACRAGIANRLFRPAPTLEPSPRPTSAGAPSGSHPRRTTRAPPRDSICRSRREACPRHVLATPQAGCATPNAQDSSTQGILSAVAAGDGLV